MKYLIDVEIKGLMAVEAKTERDAIKIAQSINTDKLKKSLLDYDIRFFPTLKSKGPTDVVVFTKADT